VDTEADLNSVKTCTFNKPFSFNSTSVPPFDHNDSSTFLAGPFPLRFTFPSATGMLDGFLPITCLAIGLNIGIDAQITPKLVSSVVQIANENESHCANFGFRN
jgi:hypothetical protein